MGIRGTDANYASRLYKEHTETPRFEADSAMMTKLCFAVNHYAGQVKKPNDRFFWLILVILVIFSSVFLR